MAHANQQMSLPLWHYPHRLLSDPQCATRLDYTQPLDLLALFDSGGELPALQLTATIQQQGTLHAAVLWIDSVVDPSHTGELQGLVAIRCLDEGVAGAPGPQSGASPGPAKTPIRSSRTR